MTWPAPPHYGKGQCIIDSVVLLGLNKMGCVDGLDAYLRHVWMSLDHPVRMWRVAYL